MQQVMGDEKYASWEKITREELRAYLGFCILMGIAHLPALDDYWSTDPTLHYPIADRISRDRFREISHYLHFVDNTTLPPRGSPRYDRLGKVRPVIDHLSKRFTDLYEPHREVAVNEAMIKFTGRSSVKQYMPMKPIKRGIKVYATLITKMCTKMLLTHTHTPPHTHTHSITHNTCACNLSPSYTPKFLYSDTNTHMYACTYTHLF